MGIFNRKKILGALSLIATLSTTAHACSDLVGLETAIENSPLPLDVVFVSSMNRLGYGVNPHSYLNAEKIRQAEALLGRKFAAKFIADEIRASFKTANQVHKPSMDLAEKFYPTTYSYDMTAINNKFLALREQDKIDGTHNSNYYKREVSHAREARKVMSALKVSNYNVAEKLGDFWFNHFNTDSLKGGIVGMVMNDYEMQLMKKNCGTFQDMLVASASHPAMIGYLDNQKNSANILDSAGKVTKVLINENYGREVIELHTLGTGPIAYFNADDEPVFAYQQEEVYQSARVLSGWHFRTSPKVEFYFSDVQNDKGAKTFPTLFRMLYGAKPMVYNAGISEAKRFLGDLAKHPRTKKNICAKLGKSLMGRRASKEQVDACVIAYGETGNLPKMYESYLLGAEFWDATSINSGFKTPFEYTVSFYRALGFANHPEITDVNGTFASQLVSTVNGMGLPLYKVGPPTGYDIGLSNWASPAYINFGMNGAFKINPYVQVSYNGLTNQALEDYLIALPAADGKSKEEVQYNKVVKEIVPAFAIPEVTVFKNRIIEALQTGSADKKQNKPVPLRTITTQLVSSAHFMRK